MKQARNFVSFYCLQQTKQIHSDNLAEIALTITQDPQISEARTQICPSSRKQKSSGALSSLTLNTVSIKQSNSKATFKQSRAKHQRVQQKQNQIEIIMSQNQKASYQIGIQRMQVAMQLAYERGL